MGRGSDCLVERMDPGEKAVEKRQGVERGAFFWDIL